MEHIDLIGLAGLLAGVAALAVAIFGIRDVREQVRLLVTLERNRSYARLLHNMSLRFVNRREELESFSQSAEMHEFTMLVRFLDPTQTMDSAQHYATFEAMSLARDMVGHGLAKWKDDIDEESVKAELEKWQGEKNIAALRRMFGDGRPSLSNPQKML